MTSAAVKLDEIDRAEFAVAHVREPSDCNPLTSRPTGQTSVAGIGRYVPVWAWSLRAADVATPVPANATESEEPARIKPRPAVNAEPD